ncbi:TetR/AcrR family transcriptional regulator [Motiliproteus sediminis]|uniref:TetR/AcrR family transcriptional regulator n=1 Tax=Motiliproteus sediminis TaxID=1468178 RepID=UPI001AEF7041|nr:TetR/AcrR family transcriptional regulator [Motiliproteus sediminis]
MNNPKSSYHHGDLRSTLLQAATDLIREGGVEALSMRKLADRVGVSRTAPYHHFTDKHALLSALAEEGFRRFEQRLQAEVGDCAPAERLDQFVRCYMDFALASPETYNLMFGSGVWQAGAPTPTLKAEAHGSFRRYVERVEQWQAEGVLPAEVDPLRFAQISWSTLHGLARLMIDGIYVDAHHLEALLDTAVGLFRQAL